MRPEMRELCRAGAEVLAATLGSDFTWVRSLADRFAGLGLTDVGVRADTPAISGGGAVAQFLQQSLDVVRAVVVERAWRRSMRNSW